MNNHSKPRREEMPAKPKDEDKSRERKRAALTAIDQASAKRVYGEPIEIE